MGHGTLWSPWLPSQAGLPCQSGHNVLNEARKDKISGLLWTKNIVHETGLNAHWMMDECRHAGKEEKTSRCTEVATEVER